jgi:hypothetical protein
LGPPQYPATSGPDQEPSRPCGVRRCLLKACERYFSSNQPQARYCGPSCQAAARRWRRWQASRRYRQTPQGQERRREQCRRYRDRVRQRRVAAAEPALESPEGQRPAEILEDLSTRPCDRPGCYVLFVLRACAPQQHFCSCSCRQALRCVLNREARWRWRRRRDRRRSNDVFVDCKSLAWLLTDRDPTRACRVAQGHPRSRVPGLTPSVVWAGEPGPPAAAMLGWAILARLPNALVGST